ncbi:hypothetical protein GOODEAATRI_021551, partial [Goodea atripinnis]
LRCSMPTESCLNQGRCEATPDGNGECKDFGVLHVKEMNRCALTLLELFLGGKWSEDVERNKWWTLMRPGGHREILCLGMCYCHHILSYLQPNSPTLNLVFLFFHGATAGFARSWATIVLLCD